ncbi:MAG: VWA domain-containing protein [Acidobacteria bacterium]|nr:VWA domain-containing protein [Acidobacteriota bacterium]
MKFRTMARGIGLFVMPVLLATAILSAQQAGTVFRATTNYVSTDVVVRDREGKFIPDLRAAEVTVTEDGVPQKIERFIRMIGGRTFTEIAAPAPTMRASEGLILPKVRQTNDVSGRIFMILIDDLHLQTSDTPRIKQALKEIRDTLIHDNDLVGFVSTGPSGIEINPTYDFGRRRFDEAINKVIGAGMKINEILDSVKYEGSNGNSGPPGMRQNAHTAFLTAYRMMEELAKINDRRKSFIYVSSGYTFDPFREGRYARIQAEYQRAADTPTEFTDEQGLYINRPISSAYDVDTPLADQYYMQKTEFAESDLVHEIAQLTREARRANVVFYTLDPRGLTTSSIPIDVLGLQTPADWRDYITTQTNSLRVLGEETGGFCICQTNDYKKGLQRIDAETSDYYMIGYTSSNPDPFKIRRQIKIAVSRPEVSELIYRDSYTIPRPKGR